jgi:hypothetical protein
MLTIDENKFLGRHYFTLDRKSSYICRGVCDGTGTVCLIGEFTANAQSSTPTDTRMATHKIVDVTFIT